jgi:glycosyltransferase involved in cell wall biosynthesis
VYAAFADLPVVSISKDQRRPIPNANWVGTVHHGLPRDLLPFNRNPRGGYLAFLGRISPEKGPDRAIEIATRAGMKLKMAAKIDKSEEAYWRSAIKPLVDSNPNVEFVGEIAERHKADFLGNAAAVLFPIDWPEPFGLVMIEAMACGTPIIAFRMGSAPEIIEDGVSGFLVDTIEEAVGAVQRIRSLDRAEGRRAFEERFTVDRMTQDYLAIYRARAGLQTGAFRARRPAINRDLQVVA